MQVDNYLLYLENSAKENSEKAKRHLIKQFVGEGIVILDNPTQLHISDDIPDLSTIKLTEQFEYCIHNIKKAQLYYEKWEFIKDYKYSVLFTCDEFDAILEKVSSITQLIGTETLENEYFFEWQTAGIENYSPLFYSTEDISFVKFNLKFEAIHPQTSEELFLKYPFVLVLHKDLGVVEFRFDSIKRVFVPASKEASIYADLVSTFQAYAKDKWNAELVPLDLNYMVGISKSETDVKLIAQYMKLPSGGNAQLEVGNNQEYMLPFLGEMRTILTDYKTELENVPKLKESLEQLMYGYEEMADYPWIELLWENEVKTRSIHVKFIFNYMNKNYCLLQHYTNYAILGMERMNHVVKYIIDHRGDIAQTTE